MLVPPHTPQYSHVKALTPIWKWGALEKYFSLDEVTQVDPSWWDPCPYEKRKKAMSLHCTHQEHHTSAQPEGRQSSVSQEAASAGPNPAGTLNLDVQPPELGEIHTCC